MEQDYFDDLIRRYNEDRLTQEETEILSSWLDSIELNSNEKLWTLKDKQFLKNRLNQHLQLNEPRYPLWRKIAGVAAAVLLLFLSGYTWYQIQNPTSAVSETQIVNNPIIPAQSRGILYHEGGEKVQLNALKEDTIYRFDNLLVERIAENEIRIIPQEGAQETLQYIEAPKGGNFVIQLEDGSRLTLNANSSIGFPTSFAASHRTVETRGEVFFEVEKDKQKRPFIVKAGETSIKVLGTKFNVHYKEGAVLRTALFEGKVLVTSPHFEVQLSPGKELSVNENGRYVVKAFAVEQVGAWKEGYFSLDNKNIAEIMEELADWYDVKVIYTDADLTVRYQGSVSKFSDINTVLELLSLAKGNTFKIEGRCIMVK